MADKTMGAQDFLMFQTLLNQVGPRSYANQALYGMFPKTAAAAAGMPMAGYGACLLYTSPSPRDLSTSRMPSSA